MKSSHFNRHQRYQEFCVKVLPRFGQARFPPICWSAIWWTDSCLVWKWLLCEMSLHLFYSIDNGPFFACEISMKSYLQFVNNCLIFACFTCGIAGETSERHWAMEGGWHLGNKIQYAYRVQVHFFPLCTFAFDKHRPNTTGNASIHVCKHKHTHTNTHNLLTGWGCVCPYCTCQEVLD